MNLKLFSFCTLTDLLHRGKITQEQYRAEVMRRGREDEARIEQARRG